jgi:hypothetical protein
MHTPATSSVRRHRSSSRHLFLILHPLTSHHHCHRS